MVAILVHICQFSQILTENLCSQ